ncbi:uncharacterized protein N7479_002474 [Penicillium vulpinum]|uniref:Uncharacterized protein n=1 Tax=Penicillium vulpinum TaxID=29845 RepID=A0A1V6RH74_9EURO|nr:uncharacterized protein N7479_002474 [Penicillium vulpinum]KAJ5972556.1 hypothetical protein N7479_002474 [Penicillium vulpinum]OQE01162.1 hypothetical protein PENVUL_c044G05000 [Penicillium vulpinum]
MSVENFSRLPFHGCNFLESLPSSIPRYQYVGIQQFHNIINIEFDRLIDDIAISSQEFNQQKKGKNDQQLDNNILQHTDHTLNTQKHGSSRKPKNHQPADEFVLFTIDSDSLKRDFLDSHTLNSYIDSFDIKNELLLVKMASTIHSNAIGEISRAIDKALEHIGLADQVKRFEGAVIRGADENGQGKGKVGDHGWGLQTPPAGFPDKPTVTLTVAYSESEKKLRSDVEFWLNPDQGCANTTLTLRIDKTSPFLIFSNWQKAKLVTRHSTHWKGIEKVQTIIITMGDDGEVTVSGHPLVIPFELFFR